MAESAQSASPATTYPRHWSTLRAMPRNNGWSSTIRTRGGLGVLGDTPTMLAITGCAVDTAVA